MILHWLAGYSTAQLMMVVGFLFGILGNVTQLLPLVGNKNRPPLPVTLAGIGGCGGMAVSVLLRGKPQWADLSDDSGMAGGVLLILYSATMIAITLMRRGRKNATAVAPVSAPSLSDKIWPPPPTSPGG